MNYTFKKSIKMDIHSSINENSGVYCIISYKLYNSYILLKAFSLTERKIEIVVLYIVYLSMKYFESNDNVYIRKN